ncbi:hypothetical protein CC85DRAFT_288890 [Cutaneotrichosporon oleaginosum]|uniref:Uncharacterized protein n=1 Tax=Cutaneotrichosporon oleaginosum TaxID=879819 RepID=A0A0J0XDF3_9TREE|nr:uncharacterized protein CC85DRAFT_288890 [Cutaneotrichosporon oleaginosum]KLT39120.1 hypothetical protein CC85DRAFT_288890 [Cutaneotrichosporon oleaginosum]TXT10460.1 hypothetical protein COLE_04394 [Cutaneotrichosporon oleaginosum]
MDASSFPTLVDEILLHLSRNTLRTLRLVSHDLKERADRLLSDHVRLHLGNSPDDPVLAGPLGLQPKTWLPRTIRAHADAPASFGAPESGAAEMVKRAQVVDIVWGPDTHYLGYPASFAPRHALEDAIAGGALSAHSVRVYLPGWRDSFTNGQALHIRADLPDLIVFAPDGRGDLNALPTMRRVCLAVDGGIHRRIPHLRLERYEAGPDEYVVHLLAEGSLPGRAKRAGIPDAREEVGMLFRDTLVGDFMLALDRWARSTAARDIDLGWGPDPEVNVEEDGEWLRWLVESEDAFIHPALSRRPARYTFVGGQRAITGNFGLLSDAPSLDIGRAVVRTMLRSRLANHRWVPVPVILRLVSERVRFLDPEEYAAEVGPEQFALETCWDPYDGSDATYLA